MSIYHLHGWHIDLLTMRVHLCPDAFKGWTVHAYSVHSAHGNGYLDNTEYAELTLVSPDGHMVKHTAIGVYIGPDWRAATQARQALDATEYAQPTAAPTGKE